MQQRPWLAQYEPGVPPDLTVPDEPFHRLVTAAAAGAPTFPAVEFYGRHVSYADLDTGADRVAHRLAALPGFEPGATVAVNLPNGPLLAQVMLGVWKAGGVVAAAGPDAPGDWAAALAPARPLIAFVARERLVADCRDLPVVALPTAQSLPPLLRLLHRLRSGRTAPLGRAVAWSRWLQEPAPPLPAHAIRSTDSALWVARANGPLVFSHGQLVAGAAMLRAWLIDAVQGDETWLLLADLASPLGAVAGLGACPMMRARLLVMADWAPEDAVDALRYQRPSYVLADARSTARVAGASGLDRTDLRQLRAFLVGGPIPSSVAQSFLDTTGRALCVGCESRWAAGLVTCPPVNGHPRLSGIGVPLPGVSARIMLPGGRPAAPLEAGMLELAAANGPPGWWSTDLWVRMDAGGHLNMADGQGAAGHVDRSGQPPASPP